MPPCNTDCQKPFLMEENEFVWNLWKRASHFDRPMGFGGALPLGTKLMFDICEQHDATMEDYEKMIVIEEVMYPKLVKKDQGE